MGRIKAGLRKILLLVIMIFCYTMALIHNSEVSAGEETQMLYMKNDFLTGKAAKEIQKKEMDNENPLQFTLWGAEEEKQISGEIKGRIADTDIIYISGDSNLLFRNQALLMAGDAQGCLISEDVAYNLHGTKEAAGMTISYNKKVYTIRGVLKDTKKTLVIQADDDTKEILNATVLKIPSDKTKNSVIQQYETRYSKADSKIDLNFFASWGRIACGLLPLVMGCFLFMPAVKTAMGLRRSPIKCLVWAIGILLLGAVFIWLHLELYRFRLDAVPNRWSDFDFWSRLIKQKSEELDTIIALEKRAPERMVIRHWIDTVKYSLNGVFIFVVFVRREKIAKLSEAYLLSILCICTVFVTIIVTGAGNIEGIKSLWGLPCMYILGKYIWEKFKLKEKPERTIYLG